MQLKVFLTLFAAAASAALLDDVPEAPRKLTLMALRSGAVFHPGIISASQNKLWLSLPADKLDAECQDGQQHTAATVYIQDGKLVLYGTGKADEGKEVPVQQFVVDRSGNGQGELNYYTQPADAPPPTGDLEVVGWEIDTSENLTFKGNNLIACPAADGSWAVWVNADVQNPGGNEGCLGFVTRVEGNYVPVGCEYSGHP
ncbi:hypothetical protein B0J18DRAFT_283546 [Chaetomium sp. MPI-SDFR-AT-0129]|nr:hypothetical protein B0J18DRAFT_283546 [Chaetomium sp. MPI-SDFR-AT-0129]